MMPGRNSMPCVPSTISTTSEITDLNTPPSTPVAASSAYSPGCTFQCSGIQFCTRMPHIAPQEAPTTIEGMNRPPGMARPAPKDMRPRYTKVYRARAPGEKLEVMPALEGSTEDRRPIEKSLTIVWWVEDKNSVATSLCCWSPHKKRTPYSRTPPTCSSFHQSSGRSMHVPAAHAKKKPHTPTSTSSPTTSRMRCMCIVFDARIFHSHIRIELKAAPSSPAITKFTSRNGSCMSQSLTSMRTRLEYAIAPWAAPAVMIWMVNVDKVPAMKQRQATLRDQNEHASSMEYSTPPMGAPKAAAMPALTPAEMNSRWSVSLTMSSSTLKLSPLLRSRFKRNCPKMLRSFPLRTSLQST
mmetsp:Transcript_28671/g.77297  ORF Transcript_28671/g.77297 Transcript_28671/m.77297 type:complete len:354 (+) Transcript_28671:558-1619(+)